MAVQSQAYEAGYNSSLDEPYLNPYPEDSREFDDYERGRTQKLKRFGSNCSFSFEFDDEEKTKSTDSPLVPLSSESSVKPNPYARAKSR